MPICIKKNGQLLESFVPDFRGKHICIGIDSSKSDTGFVVGDTEKNFLGAYEFLGGGSEVDVFTLCRIIKEQLDILLEDAVVEIVGIEDIITKKYENKGGGKGKSKSSDGPLSTHMNRMKLTSVWTRFIFYFQDKGVPVKLVNNQTWKAAILPPEFNTKTIYKGSIEYYKAIGHPYGNLNDNVTDAACILEYVWLENEITVYHQYDNALQYSGHKAYGLYPLSFKPNATVKLYRYNDRLSFMENIDTICELTESKYTYGVTVVPISAIPIDYLFQGLRGNYTEPTQFLALVIRKR